MAAVIPRAEVAKHNRKESGWFIINNDVYDVSKFYDDHPGGRDILLSHIGTDATDDFEAVHHSKGAMRKLDGLKVGTLPPDERHEFISMAAVSAHKDATGCWMVLNSKVYDVTPFLDNHPGGRDILLYNAGTDATQAFTDNGHSDAAYSMLKKYCIGDLEIAERRPYVNRKTAGSAHGGVAEASAASARKSGNESLLTRIQEQLMLFMLLGLFVVAGYLCLS